MIVEPHAIQKLYSSPKADFQVGDKGDKVGCCTEQKEEWGLYICQSAVVCWESGEETSCILQLYLFDA